MANNRKIQGEIDKLLKKVQEGMDVYEEVYNKVMEAPNQMQKEKHEADLKKEIKKLQRLREQIKSYIASNDVKDKKALDSARRSIEGKMESFKLCERETKTKAYSKEGLAAAARTDPTDTPKAQSVSWIRDAISDLKEQSEALDFEIEQDGGSVRGTRGGKRGPADEKEERLLRMQFHITKLEQLLRMVENDELAPQDVDLVEDDVEAFVEHNPEADFKEAEEDVYEQFGLPDVPLTPFAPGTKEEPAAADATAPAQPAAPEAAETNSAKTKAQSAPAKREESGTPGGRVIIPKKDTPPTAAAKAPVKAQPAVQKKLPEVPAAAAAGPAPAKKTPQQPAQPQLVPKVTVKTPTSSPLQPAARPTLPLSPSREAAALSSEGQLEDDLDEKNDDTFGDDVVPPSSGGTLADMARMTQMMTTDWERSAQNRQPTAWDRGSPQKLAQSTAKKVAPPAAVSSPPAQPAVTPTAAPQPQVLPPQQAPATQQPAQSTPQPQATKPPERSIIHRMLEQSVHNLPHPNDCERVKPYVPPNPHRTPPYYPQSIHPAFSTPEVFTKFDTDTLFFIFYYQQSTYQQYLAARELKRQSWRYHKKFQTWFQRHDKPKLTTDEYEQGAYVYFDYESGWCQRIKGEFAFKYMYLEDELQQKKDYVSAKCE